MREIRFRAFVQTHEGTEMVNDWCFLNKEDNHFNAVDLTNDRIDIGQVHAVMQYTGLKDKNGVEIYEGDILMYCDNWQFISQEDTSHHTIFWDYENARFWDKRLEDGDSLSCYLDNSIEWVTESKVIGNIYQNKELL